MKLLRFTDLDEISWQTITRKRRDGRTEKSERRKERKNKRDLKKKKKKKERREAFGRSSTSFTVRVFCRGFTGEEDEGDQPEEEINGKI